MPFLPSGQQPSLSLFGKPYKRKEFLAYSWIGSSSFAVRFMIVIALNGHTWEQILQPMHKVSEIIGLPLSLSLIMQSFFCLFTGQAEMPGIIAFLWLAQLVVNNSNLYLFRFHSITKVLNALYIYLDYTKGFV